MKKFVVLLSAMFSANLLKAQNMFGSWASDIKSEIEGNFPIVAGIILLVGVAFNLGKFFGEERDIKKGLTNIFVYVGGLLIAIAAYAFVTRQTL